MGQNLADRTVVTVCLINSARKQSAMSYITALSQEKGYFQGHTLIKFKKQRLIRFLEMPGLMQ